MEYYQIYESGTTYLLAIDHDKKVFSVGSFKGKPGGSSKFKPIDETAYRSHITRIGVDYRCIDNQIKWE